MTSIKSLLSKRHTKLIGKSGDTDLAHSRLAMSKMLADSYETFNSLRLHLESTARKGKPKPFSMEKDFEATLQQLIKTEYIQKSRDNEYKYVNHDARAYLAGGWLEEYIYCAMQKSNPDEALFQQQVEWQVGKVTGRNEIDVIARKGDILSLVSCKAVHWNYRSHKQSDRDKLKSFLLETDYWDTHFSSGAGRAVLAITQDLVDEANNHSIRSPTIFARADILNVDILSLDFFKWDVLTERLRRHWD